MNDQATEPYNSLHVVKLSSGNILRFGFSWARILAARPKKNIGNNLGIFRGLTKMGSVLRKSSKTLQTLSRLSRSVC